MMWELSRLIGMEDNPIGYSLACGGWQKEILHPFTQMVILPAVFIASYVWYSQRVMLLLYRSPSEMRAVGFVPVPGSQNGATTHDRFWWELN